MESAIFWASGALFFAVQARILLRLLKARREADEASSVAIHAEIIWTLIPAAFVAALSLMLLDRGVADRAAHLPLRVEQEAAR